MKKLKEFLLFVIFILISVNSYSQEKDHEKLFLEMLDILCENQQLQDFKERFGLVNDYKRRLIISDTGTPITETKIKDGYVVASENLIHNSDGIFYLKTNKLTFSKDSCYIEFKIISKDDNIKGNCQFSFTPNDIERSEKPDLRYYKIRSKVTTSRIN